MHIEHIPARPGRSAPWPGWVPAQLIDVFAARGIAAPWTHQAAAASHAHAAGM
jgi:DEAD/DEAH box helicase domain-containing protein